MSEPFVGEITMFAGNFAPRGWAFCDGQLLAVSQNDALFSLLGTIYGGDGRTTFGLPDLRGRIPIHAGSGPGLTPRQLGSKSGEENVMLTVSEMPSHSHQLTASAATADSRDPVPDLVFATAQADTYVEDLTAANMNASAISSVGGGQSHSNLMPFTCIHFIIALFGIYPSRT